MKKITTIFIIFYCNFCVYSQSKEFLILDSLTNKPLNLVHITYPSLSVGSVTNIEGKIKIPINKKSILISHINYKEKVLSYKDFININSIVLSPKPIELNEIVVSNIKLKEKFSSILDTYLNVYSSKKIINYSTYKETFKVNDSLTRLFQTQLKWWSKNSLISFKKPIEKQNKIEIENVDYSKIKKRDESLKNSNGGYIENKEFFKFLHLNFLLNILINNSDDFFIHKIKKSSNNVTITFDGVFYQKKIKVFEFVNSAVTFTSDYSAITNLKLNMLYNTDFKEKSSKGNNVIYKTKTTKHDVEISFKELVNKKLSINYYTSGIDAIIKINNRTDTVVGTQSLFVTKNVFGKNLKNKNIIKFNEPFFKNIPDNTINNDVKILLTKEEKEFLKLISN